MSSSAKNTTERDFSTFSTLALKPLLEFIASQSLTSMPASGVTLVDFVVDLLTANKQRINEMCAFELNPKLRKSSVLSEKSSEPTNVPRRDYITSKESGVFLKCQSAVLNGMKRRDTKALQRIFDVHSNTSGCLNAATLLPALIEADAAVIPDSEAAAHEAILGVDVDCNGTCDFSEFARMANVPDELSLYYHEKQMPALADALRALVGRGNNQLLAVSQLPDEEADAAVAALASCLSCQARALQDELRCLFRVQSEVVADEPLSQDSKFGMPKMSCGDIEDFHKGLTGRVGVPHLDFKREMLREHCVRYGCNTQFTTRNYGITTTPRQEWKYIVSDALGESGQLLEGVPCPEDQMKNGRKIGSISDLMQLPLVQQAGLNDYEVLALVLYSGPMFYVYNVILRQHPEPMYHSFREGGNTFPTTIFVLVSAVTKVTKRTRIPRGTLLYRGLGGRMDLPDKFFNVDATGTSGYADWGFMSTTADLNVALGYSGLRHSRSKAMVMVMETTSIDKGADISMFSQYPCEKEFLWVPCSFIQRAIGVGSRVEVVDNGLVTFVPVKVNLNLRMETVEELMEKKKRSHVVAAHAMVDDVRFEVAAWAASSESAERLRCDAMPCKVGSFDTESLAAAIVKQCEAVVLRHDNTSVHEYIDDVTFRMLVSEMLDVRLWTKEKIMLWMQDKGQYLCYLQDWSLRECHRMWQAYLRRLTGSTADKALNPSLELLVSSGLVKRSERGLVQCNADNEPVLVQAGADGWAPAYICAAVSSGADIEAANALGCNGAWNAARYGHAMSLSALISARVDPNKCNNNGASPMFIAALNGHADCVGSLISQNCDVARRHSNGASPLFVAAQNGHTSVISLLVTANADVNVCDNTGASPIFVAASNGHSDCIPLLIGCNGDVSKCNNDGMSPLSSAACNGHAACISQLLLAGNRDSSMMADALEKARAHSRGDCVRVLEDALGS